jgi:diguanylate cyclase (GGDEF)-like protein
MSLTDVLTGTENRRAFDEALPQDVARARRQGCALGLVLLDLDDFKTINDTLGHPAGDEILAAFAGRLRSITREADRLFRYGGDEFALLVAKAGPAGVLSAAWRAVRATAAAPLVSYSRTVTCSAGVSALAPDEGGAGAGLVARADAALYAAKRAGRNRAVAFESTRHGYPDWTAAQERAC